MELFYVWDRRDKLASFICKECIQKHKQVDLSIDYFNTRRGQCPDSLHIKPIKEYPETHQQGYISIENNSDWGGLIKGDLGIQIAKDGRVWICINGESFIRFRPKGN